MSRFQSFHIYRRKNSKGKFIHYVRFLDPDTGKTIRALSSGLGNRTAATRWAELKLPEIEAEQAAKKQSYIPTVVDYTKNYFRTDHGYTVARVYLYTCRCYTKNHIIPKWGHYRLNELTSKIIDKDIVEIFRADEIASGTVNRILRVLQQGSRRGRDIFLRLIPRR